MIVKVDFALIKAGFCLYIVTPILMTVSKRVNFQTGVLTEGVLTCQEGVGTDEVDISRLS